MRITWLWKGLVHEKGQTRPERPVRSNVVNACQANRHSVAAAPVQSQLKPGAEPSLAEAQPELPSDGSHISAISGSG